MMTKDNLPQLLIALGFTQQGATYRKTIAAAVFKVDTDQAKISYPEGVKVNGEFTCNFSSPENFVVLECVHRLLEKGYKPEHIELEPKWKLGHGASGGRADILVSDNQQKPLLIIECKTAGREFDKAWRNTLQDGDQLFSYAQQISETQFLCLYTSDFDNGAVSYQSHIIAHRDNEKYLADNPNFKSFNEASDVKSRYTVWRDTYKLDYTSKGIFEDNIQPYHIGKDKYSLADLQPISAADQQKKYHEFATILRQHNVSGRENAFDKLVNLFLCKLVDETENPHELKFYWKGVAYDTHFELLDRLQQLYQAGMGKFLGESITYIDQSAVRNAMRFIKQNPDATQKAVWSLFVQQKFFTNNDFSLIDVHNEKLFYQNAEVLLKILQMWQDIRLTNGSGNNQFLGDMFEGFLDQGVKQSEGQYFTPMPICRFILMSLPLQSLIQHSSTPLKAIDYACGAGHFLNELATQLKPLVAQHKQADIAEYHKAIYGIEKEYRLSKVAKVSAFMYGQADINICYGDALVNQHAAFPDIQDGSFDVLVANPPYSVRGFLETLSEEERGLYSLADTIDKLDTANSIETFFIERAKQLLKPGGVAALILPSSILSNGGNTYVKTREILLQYFDLVAIAEFGSGTFGKTGTNTVTLFLRRKPTQPDTAEHYRERVAQWFNGENVGAEWISPATIEGATTEPPFAKGGGEQRDAYQDTHLIAQYAAHIGVAASDYHTLLAGQPSAALLAHETFAQYRKAFEASSEIVSLKKAKGFKARSQAGQDEELAKRFTAFVQTIERDKLYHYVMAADQPNPVLVIRSPGDTKAQKQFLGYDWSSAKGDEGIKLTKDANGHHLTPLYDETNRDNAEKINSLIAENFAAPSNTRHSRAGGNPDNQTRSSQSGEQNPTALSINPLDSRLRGNDGGESEGVVIPPALSDYASSVRLVDMLDFSRVTLEKQISVITKRHVEIISRWPLERVSNLVEIISGGTPDTANEAYWGGNIPWLSVADFSSVTRFVEQAAKHITDDGLNNSSTKLLQPDDLIISARGTVGALAQLRKPMAFNQSCYGLRTKSAVSNDYLFYVFGREIQQLKAQAFGSKFDAITIKTFDEVKLPVPPASIQQKIVAECEAVDAEAAAAQAKAAETHSLIVQSVSQHFGRKYQTKEIDQIATVKGGKRIPKEDGYVDGVTNYPYIRVSDFWNRTIRTDRLLYISKETFMKIRNYTISQHDVYISIAGTLGLCGTVPGELNGKSLTENAAKLVIKKLDEVDTKYLAIVLNHPSVQAQIRERKKGVGVPKLSLYEIEKLIIPVPPKDIQISLVAEVEALERTIAAVQAVIAAAPAKKQAIMQRYL